MIEKTLMEWVLLPMFGILGWQERSKVGRPECSSRHQGTDDKLDLIYAGMTRIEDKLDRHIDR
jgi:hypothetical protein